MLWWGDRLHMWTQSDKVACLCVHNAGGDAAQGNGNTNSANLWLSLRAHKKICFYENITTWKHMCLSICLTVSQFLRSKSIKQCEEMNDFINKEDARQPLTTEIYVLSWSFIWTLFSSWSGRKMGQRHSGLGDEDHFWGEQTGQPERWGGMGFT